MKAFFSVVLLQGLLLSSTSSAASFAPRAGFQLPDSICEVSFRYKMVNNLILLPVTINDSIQVNLILDTGCRNLILFGKHFKKLFRFEPNQKVWFSGLGEGDPVYGKVSLENRVSIDALLGERVPVVVVSDQNLFSDEIHGVIGYDIFTMFEVEIDPARHRITFRPASTAMLAVDYIPVPIRIEDSRPLIDCRVIFTNDRSHLCDLMLDTGSSLGLLIKTTEIMNYSGHRRKTVLGRGLNGFIEGIRMTTEKLIVSGLEIHSISTGIIHSPKYNYASIGMGVLKDYSLVLNYCKGYAGFRKVA
jgi:hypothetical protein